MVISRLIHSLSLELPLTPVPNTPLNGDYWTSEHSPCSTLTGYLTFILIIVRRGSPWHFSSIRCIKYLSTSRILFYFFWGVVFSVRALCCTSGNMEYSASLISSPQMFLAKSLFLSFLYCTNSSSVKWEYWSSLKRAHSILPCKG